MASYNLVLRDSEAPVKARDPLVVAILSFITLGIYFFVWWYKINRELRDYGQSKGYDLGQSPASSTVAVTLGALIIVPAVLSLYRGTRRVQGAERVAGTSDMLNGWIALVLYVVFSPAFVAYLQSQLNKVWQVDAEPVAGESGPPKPGDEMPPRLGGEPGPA